VLYTRGGIALNKRVVYLNGEFVPEKEARISIYDSALMFGDMVFEMTRSFNGVQFKLREHLLRLKDSTRALHIPLQMTIGDTESTIEELLKRNGGYFDKDDEIRLLINVSRGPLSIYGEVFDGKLEPTIVISAFPLKWVLGPLAHLYHTGVHAIIPSQRAIPAHLLDPKIKSRSRLHLMMANLEIARYNDDRAWALLLDPDGYVTEGTGANFFIVRDGNLITPKPHNILRGISREYVMKELALEPVFQKNIEPYYIATADEAFFTATPFCIMPVTKFNGMDIGDGKVGYFTQLLLNGWGEKVGVDIVAQADNWSKDIKGATPYSIRG